MDQSKTEDKYILLDKVLWISKGGQGDNINMGKRPIKTSPKLIEAIRKLEEEGLADQEIERRLGLPTHAIGKRRRRGQLPARQGWTPPSGALTPDINPQDNRAKEAEIEAESILRDKYGLSHLTRLSDICPTSEWDWVRWLKNESVFIDVTISKNKTIPDITKFKNDAEYWILLKTTTNEWVRYKISTEG